MASLASESATMYEHIAMNRRVRHTIVRTDRNMLVTSPFFNEQAADAFLTGRSFHAPPGGTKTD